ncbi:cytochrome P450 [Nocardiopsis ansamitocini]|uniref:Cytochrome P450 n=1 Tax=Nocardiopsis ansamitocini TaxID=1670832 RepID=A0A9W6P851_9ACTN|nr:cytochrome P450 [Nocardiopsis ansamitocini]GLU48807.1 cytochrome P450 [Nocardiopsis ansamitocini]
MNNGQSRPTPGSPSPRCPVHDQAVPLYKDLQHSDHASLWEELRTRFGAVAPVEITPGVPGWLLLGYHENLNVLRDPARFSTDPRHWRQAREGGLGNVPGPRTGSLAGDGAGHRRLRAPIVEGLAAVTGPALGAAIERLAHALIDGFAGEGNADLIADYAAPLPVLVLNRLFGLSDEHGRLLADLTANRRDGDAAVAERAADDIRDYFTALVRRRRDKPGGDFVSTLLAHPAALSDTEAVDELLLMVGAGHEPTTHLIGNALHRLLGDSEIAVAYRGAALPAADFIDYVMWVDPPLQTLAGRYPTLDVRIGDAEIKEGDALLLGFAPAHADPATRPPGREDGIDALAGNRAHLMWGAGPHGCPAQSLAREITITAIDVLISRLGDLTLTGAPETLRRRGSLSVHGLVELPVAFAPERRPAATRPAPVPARKGIRRMFPPARTPRAQGARYGAPDRDRAQPQQAGPAASPRAPAPVRVRATGARYQAPAARPPEPEADPLELLLARWRRDHAD